MPVFLGFLLMGAAIGLIPLIVSLIKKRFVFGLIIVVACAIAAMINIVVAVGIALVGLIILLLLHKK